MAAWWAGCATAALVLVVWRPRAEIDAARMVPAAARTRRRRLLWSGFAALAGVTWVPGVRGLALGLGLGAAVWWVSGRAEPAGVRRERERARAELPHLVILLGAALRAGADPAPALELVSGALPGAASARLAPVVARLRLGADPALVWAELGGDAELAALGRCLARAHATGAPVADAVTRLGQELAAERRSEAQDRARTVGVRAALPLGLCLLPAFLLLGIVPVVAGLAESLLRS
ncbi:type II secretion system F family protein [Nocardioides sp.]|uniref:type II secretion system F family protein n=1 Tax=Nocardioides sp. TaxID=35761 RepID=UPI00352935F6